MTKRRWYNQYEDTHAYFWTSSIVDFLPVFKYEALASRMLEILEHMRKRYQVAIHGYVIMPEHLHAATSAENGDNLKRFIQNTLRTSAIEIGNFVDGLASNGDRSAGHFAEVFHTKANGKTSRKIWQEHPRLIVLHNRKMLDIKLNYIHANPVKRGLVISPGDYRWSSFNAFHGYDSDLSLDPIFL